jgi:hypothetical protein
LCFNRARSASSNFFSKNKKKLQQMGLGCKGKKKNKAPAKGGGGNAPAGGGGGAQQQQQQQATNSGGAKPAQTGKTMKLFVFVLATATRAFYRLLCDDCRSIL